MWNKRISKGCEQNMTKKRSNFKSKYGTQRPMIRTWNVQNIGLSGTLLWKHEKTKHGYGARLYPKLMLNKLKVKWGELCSSIHC